MKNNSLKIWAGESPFDHNAIFASMTGINGLNLNPKIGRMTQVWILSQDSPPYEMIKRGDYAVCGNCELSPHLKRKEQCYIARRAFQAPSAVWKSQVEKTISLQDAIQHLVENPVKIRFGAYGDPAMIPQSVFESLLSPLRKKFKTKTHTAYTHQHAYRFARWMKRYAMASCSDIKTARKLWRAGWRTFRIIDSLDGLVPKEILCPNVSRDINCDACCLCNGKVNDNDNRPNVAILRH